MVSHTRELTCKPHLGHQVGVHILLLCVEASAAKRLHVVVAAPCSLLQQTVLVLKFQNECRCFSQWRSTASISPNWIVAHICLHSECIAPWSMVATDGDTKSGAMRQCCLLSHREHHMRDKVLLRRQSESQTPRLSVASSRGVCASKLHSGNVDHHAEQEMSWITHFIQSASSRACTPHEIDYSLSNTNQPRARAVVRTHTTQSHRSVYSNTYYADFDNDIKQRLALLVYSRVVRATGLLAASEALHHPDDVEVQRRAMRRRLALSLHRQCTVYRQASIHAAHI